MNCLLAAVLLPLHFTAPADTLGVDAAGRVHLSPEPVHAYVFQQLDENKTLVSIPGYADSMGSTILTPHAPGTRETVWFALDANENAVTIYVMSLDRSGNLSAPSNGCVVGREVPAMLAMRRATRSALDVPVFSQTRQRRGQAALAMVLRYYGAKPAALREVDGAYDPILRRSLITDLASAARRAGYDAAIATLTPDSLIDLLSDGVPPILLCQSATESARMRHYCVVTGWNSSNSAFTVHDGTARPRVSRRDDLVKEWETAGSLALVVRQRGQ